MTKKRKLAYVALLLNAIIWGAALPVVKPALEYITPFQYLFYRYLIAAVFSLPILIFLIAKTRPSLKILFSIFSLEFLVIVVGHYLLYMGLSKTTALEASFITNAIPVLVVIGGTLWLKERQEKHELIGLALSIAAITFITLEPLFFDNQELSNVSGLGNLMVLVYVLIWAFYMLTAKKVYKKVSKSLIGFLSVWVGMLSFLIINILVLPEMFLTGEVIDKLMIPPVFWAAVYMGILGSVVAVPAIIYGNNLIEASEASLFVYVQPLVYVPLAVFWLGESVSALTILALVILALGIVIAQHRPVTVHTS